jgi:hypothetical protein
MMSLRGKLEKSQEEIDELIKKKEHVFLLSMLMDAKHLKTNQ